MLLLAATPHRIYLVLGRLHTFDGVGEAGMGRRRSLPSPFSQKRNQSVRHSATERALGRDLV